MDQAARPYKGVSGWALGGFQAKREEDTKDYRSEIEAIKEKFGL